MKSDHEGVYWDNSKQKWFALWWVVPLGFFDTEEEAIEAIENERKNR